MAFFGAAAGSACGGGGRRAGQATVSGVGSLVCLADLVPDTTSDCSTSTTAGVNAQPGPSPATGAVWALVRGLRREDGRGR